MSSASDQITISLEKLGLETTTLIAENKNDTNTVFMSFETCLLEQDVFQKLTQFKKYLHGDNSPFKALLISSRCYILISSMYSKDLQPYIIDFDNLVYTPLPNITFYVTGGSSRPCEVRGKYPEFEKFNEFVQDLTKQFGRLNFVEAFVDVKAELDYVPIDWLQFRYQSYNRMCRWMETPCVDLFQYKESPYRLMFLGGTAYIFRKEDCPQQWDPLYSTHARRHTIISEFKVLDERENYKHTNNKEFVLPWKADPMLELVLSVLKMYESEIQLVHSTGSIKHNGCTTIHRC